jgi:hypothetical protein
MPHGGVRESQPVYSESQIAIWSMLFLNFCDVKKRHKSDHPNIRTFVRRTYMQIKSSCRSAIHNSGKRKRTGARKTHRQE